MAEEYRAVTECPGGAATSAELKRAGHRYAFVLRRAAGRDVLEVACGAGFGLPMLARRAQSVTAGDLAWSNVREAVGCSAGRARIVRFDAEELPFAARSFDLVVLLEAVYYLDEPRRFLFEGDRVLRDGGELVLASVNPAWRDFSPSPLSRRYFDSRELRHLLTEAGFAADVFAAFPAGSGPVARAVAVLRRTSSRLALPWPAGARARIRRFLHGRAIPYPPDLSVIAADEPVVVVAPGNVDTGHQVLYAVGMKGSARTDGP